MIAIINYGAGNLQSVLNSFLDFTDDVIVSNNIEDLEKAEKIVLPGVGEASFAMNTLRTNKIDTFLKNAEKPVLGICLGMQLMCEYSEEGDTNCLGIFPIKVKKFDENKLKVPHMGWNTVNFIKFSKLFESIENTSYFYFANSYYIENNNYATGLTNYSFDFCSAFEKNNFYGVQFHPEKSSEIGKQIIRNFIKL